MAELVCRMTGIEMVRMVNSGTEAVMSALRLARGATGRDKIIKFDGLLSRPLRLRCWCKAGSGAADRRRAGLAPAYRRSWRADTLTAQYNDLASVRTALLDANPGQVAAIIVEPVAANMGVVLPAAGLFAGAADAVRRDGALLIFDEVITGFRLAPGGRPGVSTACGRIW